MTRAACSTAATGPMRAVSSTIAARLRELHGGRSRFATSPSHGPSSGKVPAAFFFFHGGPT
jgi:hypothetical protein